MWVWKATHGILWNLSGNLYRKMLVDNICLRCDGQMDLNVLDVWIIRLGKLDKRY
jgi:hypothetical protein